MANSAAACAAALLLSGLAHGATPAAADGQVMGTKNDRVLWIFPNYMTVDQENSRPRILPRDKLEIAFKDSLDPYAFPVAGIFAGVAQAENQYPSWGRGVDGFEKRYLAALADQTTSNVLSEGVFPVLLHQDPRYFRLGRGSVLHRLGYSLTRVFVTRADSGQAQFNYSEFGGNAVSAAVADLYYPGEDRTAGDTAARFGSQIVFDMLADAGKEFWPDIKRALLGR